MTQDVLKLALALAMLKSNDTWGSPIREAKEKAITAINEALAQPQQEIDWKDMYEKQKRRAEMWIAKYEADIGLLEKAAPQTAQPQQEPFEDLATELFIVAQVSPADDGFSDTIDRIESWLREHFSTPPDYVMPIAKPAPPAIEAAHNLKGEA